MKKEIADKWIQALRSGEYRQAPGHLKDSDGYCCLGVLCEISGLDTFSVHNTYLGQTASLPDEVREWGGLHSNNGTIQEHSANLAALNDSGYPFAWIADIIETNWETL